MSRQQAPAQLIAENGSLVLQCGYDPGLVSALKSSIPATDRKFDPSRKAWIVAPQHGETIAKIVTLYLGQMVAVPQIRASNQTELRLLTIYYISQTKDRAGYDERTALGLDNLWDWSTVFPESVLIQWFTGINDQNSAITLFGILGLSRSATFDEIKIAYRRMAKQWHPDVCKEPDARERFLKIKDAYDLLSDPNKKARYEAGLALEESLGRNVDFLATRDGYRPPLRCGYILAEGIEKVGRFNVTKVNGWEDITDNQGRTLVTSWQMGADKPDMKWV